MRNLVQISAIALLLSACGGGDPTPAPATYVVEYSVTGQGTGAFVVPTGATASLTYRNSSGGTEQKTITLPGVVKYNDFPSGGFMYMSAQKQGADGAITVSISINGKTVKTATSTSAYGIATVSGTCCN